jgi:hypothetical protein
MLGVKILALFHGPRRIRRSAGQRRSIHSPLRNSHAIHNDGGKQPVTLKTGQVIL